MSRITKKGTCHDCAQGAVFTAEGFELYSDGDSTFWFCKYCGGHNVDVEETAATYNSDHFEVSRVHCWEDESDMSEHFEKCSESGCSNEHLYSVYVRVPIDHTGILVAKWISDHTTEAMAVLAANAYEAAFEELKGEL